MCFENDLFMRTFKFGASWSLSTVACCRLEQRKEAVALDRIPTGPILAGWIEEYETNEINETTICDQAAGVAACGFVLVMRKKS